MLRILILVFALVSGGFAAWLAFAGLQPQSAAALPAAATNAVPMAEVLVATADVAAGQRLEAPVLGWQEWPEGAVGPHLITRDARPDAATALAGSVARSGFAAAEPIREDKLVPADSGFMAALLPAGKRAVAVRVSAENTAGGFILPNDRVDVIHTVVRPDADGASTSISRTILANVRVLAIDQTTNDSGSETIVVGKTATLELDPAQVEIAAAAESSGALSLSLRSVNDNEEPEAPALAGNKTPEDVTVTVIGSGRSAMVTTRAANGN